MLSQHMITKPVFDALFADYAFANHNPVSQAMQNTIHLLEERGLEKETAELDSFYRDVHVRAQGITDTAGKQSIIAELYERFLKLALPETAARLGIVCTPTPVVDYIIKSVEDVLQKEFGKSVSDEGVHIIDPFTGTGSFITRLMQSGLIKDEDLPRKYGSELHANDIMLLAYYIAAINIEATYHGQIQDQDYKSFEGIVLTDTFQSAEQDDPMDQILFPRNNERIERQRALDIRVILGNPPWSATNNRKYPTIDERIQRKYVTPSIAKKLSALYDPYVRAIRQASDRVLNNDQGGIVAFVTNGGFIDSNAFDGFRKTLAEEFHSVYCLNLRGDQRTAGERSRAEGGKIFGSGSRASVAILLLVKKPGKSAGANIFYHDIGEYLSREDKLDLLSSSKLGDTAWQTIQPNSYNDWTNQRSSDFTNLRPLTNNSNEATNDSLTPIFKAQTLGLVTSRDTWCYASSENQLRGNIKTTVKFYNEQLASFKKTKPTGTVKQKTEAAKAFIKPDAQRFHWGRENYRDVANGETYDIEETSFTIGAYRPFFKQHLYFHRKLNNSIREFPELYTNSNAENLGIYITGPGSSVPFSVLMTNHITDCGLTSGNGTSPYLFRYRYIPSHTLTNMLDPNKAELEKVSNINPEALTQFQEHYKDPTITEDHLFHYTYGVLHSQQWRDTFADDLGKSPARIPMAASADHFHAFGRSRAPTSRPAHKL